MRAYLLGFSLILLVAGCGDDDAGGGDDGGTVTGPGLIAGGGANGGAISGKLAVFVIDSDTGAPISGATIRVGATANAAAQLTGTTDATGGISFSDASLTGKQAVTATAANHAPTTWIGINAANITIPLRSKTVPPDPPSATVGATIAGWDQLPQPATNHTTLAVVTFSQTGELGDNQTFDQGTRTVPGLPNPLANNICVKGIAGGNPVSDCNLTIKTRVGKQGLIAALLDRDNRGTAPTNDDVTMLTGWALVTGLELSANQNMTGVMLTQVAAADTTMLTVNLGAPPAPLTMSQAVPQLQLGNDGGGYFQLNAAVASTAMPAVLVPKLTGPLAGAHYDVIAVANAAAGDRAQSIIVQRNVSVGAPIAISNWLAVPAQITVNNATLSIGFTPAPGATVSSLDIVRGTGTGTPEDIWTISFFDGSAAVTLPALTPDPFPAGGTALGAKANSLDIPGANLANFTVESATRSLTRVSEDTLPFNR